MAGAGESGRGRDGGDARGRGRDRGRGDAGGGRGRADVGRADVGRADGGRGDEGGRAAAGRRAEPVAPRLRERLSSVLEPAGFDLEDVAVTRAGSRSLVRVAVDRDGGIDLDAVAEASRLVSEALDAAEAAGEAFTAGPYVLEVTSPGVDRPLTAPRHWQRAVGRLVTVRGADGAELSGRVLSADESGADLAVPTGPVQRGRPPRRKVTRVHFERVARATVEVEFSASEYDDLSGDLSTRPVGDAAGSPDVPDTPGIPDSPRLPGAPASDDSPAQSGPEGDNEGRQVDAQGAAGEEMTR
ncbi:ribosome maturation factor RimP [Frankia canadensis]|uniref:ribosome maturation factor RimP n=1 Tax=Frankia canadensis TaxID=1836972 RepID=UPI00243498F8|nr:ribosome maturation factor RimP [Frankia canadensis]